MLRSNYAPALWLALSGLWMTFSYTEVRADEQDAAPAKPAAVENAATPEERIRKALDETVSLTFAETPLRDVAAQLRQRTQTNVLIDRKALDDVGVSDDLPLSGEFQTISLRSALNLLLRSVDLAWNVADGALVITTPEAAEARLMMRVYPVGELTTGPQAGPGQEAMDSLISVITLMIWPESWDEVGGPASIERYGEMLFISQVEAAHQEIAALLNALREAKKPARANEAPKQAAIHMTSANVALARALQKPISWDFDETPLTEVAAQVQELVGVPTQIDRRALDDVGAPTDLPITLTVHDMPAAQALRHALGQVDLTWVVTDEVLLITTPDEAQQRLEIRVYPVSDLPAPPQMFDVSSSGLFDASSNGLAQAISYTVEPDTWSEVGGAGAIAELPAAGVLVVAHTPAIHEKIEALLAQLRERLPDTPQAGKQEDPEALQLVVYHLPVAQPSSAAEPARLGEGAAGPSGPGGLFQQFGGMGGGVGVGIAFAPIPGNDLVEIITTLVEPESWGREDVYIKAVPARLIVRHTAATHRQIEKLLVQLGLVSPYRGGFGGSTVPVVGERSFPLRLERR